MDEILKKLNPKQKQAVQTIKGALLVLAGPGSGKTRVLTNRLAYLIKKGVLPQNILAVTFTNKAAEEMRTRVASLLAVADSFGIDQRMRAKRTLNQGRSAAMPFIGTFHAFCLRILRRELSSINKGVLGNYKNNFVIYDEKDKLSLIKQIIRDLEINKEQFNPKKVAATIAALKSETIDWQEYQKQAREYFEKTVAKIYENYQKKLEQNNALDFGDLIMFAVKIFKEYPKILKKYQEKFKYILVDEYQDTDPAQYQLIKLLAEKYKNICCVGDDAQSVYAFRNADFRNILNFEKDYPQAKIITLDQNYRSTQNILDTASQIISKNKCQKPKKLWTENDSGPPIFIIEARNEKAEAEFVVNKIKELLKENFSLTDISVFYRTNAQSRALEECFIRRGIPYKLVGSVRFYQRKEVKDIISYLKFIAIKDNFSLRRIINTPKRGIGKKTIKKIDEQGLAQTAKQQPAVNGFYGFIKKSEKLSKEKPLSQLLKFIVKKTNYRDYLKKNYGDNIKAGIPENEIRWQNIEELINVSSNYDKMPPPEGLRKFLEETALLSDADEVDQGKDLVHLMTLHTAKGLEFSAVFIIGCEEGVLPHSKSLLDPLDLEEERRLFYVGITRSKKYLYCLLTQVRTSWGGKQANPPSRFLTEAPEDLVEFGNFEGEDEDIIEF